MGENKIKLSDKQKEIILALRNGNGKFCYHKWSTKFTFNGKTVRYDIASKLAYYSKLVEPIDRKATNKYYQLTELGKSINID